MRRHREVAAAGVRAQRPRAPGRRRRRLAGSVGAERRRAATPGTSTVRSSRSRSGPDSRSRYCAICCGVHRHSRTRVAGEAARTRIHRADEHEARGKHGRPRGPRDRDAPSSSGWRSTSSDAAAELEHLVEEQHAVVREADLAGTRLRPAADERRVGDRVMRRAKRPLGEQAAAGRQQTGHRVDRRRLRALRRTSAAAGSPASASPSSSCRRPAGRPAAGCGRRRPRSRARAAPAADRARPRDRRPSAPATGGGGDRRRDAPIVGSFERADGLGQRRRPRRHVEPDTMAASPAFAAGSRMRRDAVAPRGRRDRQHAARRLDRSVERQLAEHDESAIGRAARRCPARRGCRARSAGRTTRRPCGRPPAPGSR